MRSIRGITLIALVITIIVLLILAGVSMVALMGSNGLLTKANTAKTENERVELEEQIKLAIMTSRIETNGNNIDLEILEKELIKNIGLKNDEISKEGENENLPWKVSHNGYAYRISEDGKLEETNGISLNKTKLKLVTGQTEKLEATLNGVTGNVIWSTSNSSIATVENGTVVAVGNTAGETVQIIASIEGTNYSQKCNVTIVEKVTQISAEDLTVEIGEKQKIVVTTSPSENVEDLNYEFLSMDVTKLLVDEVTGVVEGLSSGSIMVKIYAKRQDGTKILTSCTITIKSKDVYITAKEIAENPSYYYGKTVVNYGGKIFYVDKKTEEYPNGYFGDIDENEEYCVYLQTVAVVNSPDVAQVMNNYQNYNLETTKVKKMNPQWAKVRGNMENSWNESEKMAAYLNTPDTGKWITSNKSRAKYTLGGISMEMYMKAYNDVQHQSSYPKLETYFDENNNGYSYIINGVAMETPYNNILDYSNYNYIFAPKDNGSLSSMPFSSPYNSTKMCSISLSNRTLNRWWKDSNTMLFYLVCLKSDFEIMVRL